ncbi:thioredoxin domain-containing protein [Sporolactobacillus terrae]|uniref:thioredoxin domain-containing protein n=1 Tax=Sporolactobacillus terrae TaxID=269673 RepID=UPI00159BAD06|nr:thioredoxin domain-containing protein [Sporolactobacillus terrae]
MRKKYIFIVAAVLFFILVVGGIAYLKYMNSDMVKGSNSKKFYLRNQPYVGSKNAKNIIVEFSDYRCPWCKKFQQEIYPKIKKDLVDTGKTKFYYVNFTVLGPNSAKAANAAYYIYQKYPRSFFAFHDALFKAQGDEKKNWVTNDLLVKKAEQTVPNLDRKELLSVINSDKYKDQIKNIDSDVIKIGVKQTPTLMVNNKVVENPYDYEKIKALIH